MKGSDIAVWAFVIMLVCATSFPIMQERAFSSSPVYLTVEPNALPPLADLNSSVYGLEVPATPSAVGDNFTVALHFRNATATNVPRGVNGIQVQFYFGNILTYAVPTGFIDFSGATGGVLIAPVLYGLTPGFYASDGTTKVSNPPYTGAVMYEVAAASMGGVWNGEDGRVANITFQIAKQPQGNESSASLALDCKFVEFDTSTVDPNTGDILNVQEYPDSTSGNLMLDSNYKPPANWTLMVNENPAGSGAVDVKVGGVTQTSPYTFSNGTVVQATGTPNAGYSFSNWTLDGANVGSANPYSVTMNSNRTVTANFASAAPPPPLLPVALTAELTAVPPLLDVNSSLYSLETSSSQVVVGDTFTVGLHLRNVTQGNVPLGVSSIGVHFVFGNVSDYLQPLGFLNKLGAPDGVLNPDIQFAVNPGFYEMHGNVTGPPYGGAVSYDVAASSTGTGWNGVEGLVAVLTFMITKQPQASFGEGNVSFAMDYTFANLTDFEGSNILHDSVNATITLDSVFHDVAVTNVTVLKTVVGVGYLLDINVTVANHGSIAENFPLTVYANASVIDSRTISLASGNCTTVTFARNTTGFARGRYTIKAVAEPVLGETNTTDNTYIAGSVAVTIPGDVDGDGRVDLVDLVRIAMSYESQVGQPKWNPNADIDGNEIVDIFDVTILAQHYGQPYL